MIQGSKDYAQLYVNHLNKEFFENNRVTVLSHLDSLEYFIQGIQNHQYIHSFFYPNFHHWATPKALDLLTNKKRK